MRLFVLVALSALACSRPNSRIDITPVADGEWHVLYSRDDGALLREIERRAGRGARRDALPRLALLADTLRPVQVDTIWVFAAHPEYSSPMWTRADSILH